VHLVFLRRLSYSCPDFLPILWFLCNDQLYFLTLVNQTWILFLSRTTSSVTPPRSSRWTTVSARQVPLESYERPRRPIPICLNLQSDSQFWSQHGQIKSGEVALDKGRLHRREFEARGSCTYCTCEEDSRRLHVRWRRGQRCVSASSLRL